jgi:hypothetical protein
MTGVVDRASDQHSAPQRKSAGVLYIDTVLDGTTKNFSPCAAIVLRAGRTESVWNIR